MFLKKQRLLDNFKYFLFLIFSGSDIMNRYILTNIGLERCTAKGGKGDFYLQDTPQYQGHTEKIFKALFGSNKALTVPQISERTGIRRDSIYGILSWNVNAGYIRKII